MKKFLTVTTILALSGLLVLGIYAPDSAPMLLASTNEEFSYVRVSLILILASLLLYRPPRAAIFRLSLAMISIVLGITTVSMIYSYALLPLDSLMFVEAAILIMIEAAELGEKKSLPSTAPRKIPVRDSSRRKSSLQTA